VSRARVTAVPPEADSGRQAGREVHRVKRRLNAWIGSACNALDEILYGRQLAQIRYHTERIDEIKAGQQQ
jgi:hypothetical protein